MCIRDRLFAYAGSLYLTEIRPLQELGSNFAEVLTGVVKVKEILDIPVYESPNAFPADHSIDLRDVSFSYDGKATVLEPVSYTHLDVYKRQGVLTNAAILKPALSRNLRPARPRAFPGSGSVGYGRTTAMSRVPVTLSSLIGTMGAKTGNLTM